MEKYITDENTGLKYELVGDYYFLARDDEPEEEMHIGVFGQMHYRYLKENKPKVIRAMRMNGTLKSYLAEVDEHANALLSQLVNQMAKAEGITEELKAKDQMKWVGLMENIHNRAMEIVCAYMIYA